MYPFFVLDLPEQTTDAEVEARYRALSVQHPPDRAPDRFRMLREAYEQLRSESDRLKVRLFYSASSERGITEELPRWLSKGRARLSAESLRALLDEADA